jgi:hypothetical protein
MRLPNMLTPVSKCMELSDHSMYMLAKFPENPRLAELSRRMGEGGQALEDAQRLYEREQRAQIRLRIDVSFEDHVSDARIRRTRKLIEIDDGRRGGRIASQVFPAGSLDFTRIQGATQVDAMRQLEARLAAAQDIWPEAAAELAAITAHRQRYATALAARDQGNRRIKDLRTARDATKERFVHLYAEIVSLVSAEFPRDRATVALFFLDASVRRPGRARPGDGDEQPDEPDAGPDEPGEPGGAEGDGDSGSGTEP